MKNVIKVLGIIALVAVIGLSFFSCDTGGGGGGGGSSNPGGTAKSITITGINGKSGEDIGVELFSSTTGGVARGLKTISGDSVTIPLQKENGSAWTESGLFNVYLYIGVVEFKANYSVTGSFNIYLYSNGRTLMELVGVNNSEDITEAAQIELHDKTELNINQAVTTFAFDQFVDVTLMGIYW